MQTFRKIAFELTLNIIKLIPNKTIQKLDLIKSR